MCLKCTVCTLEKFWCLATTVSFLTLKSSVKPKVRGVCISIDVEVEVQLQDDVLDSSHSQEVKILDDKGSAWSRSKGSLRASWIMYTERPALL